MKDTLYESKAKRLAQAEIDKIGQRKEQLERELNENQAFTEWKSLKNPDRGTLEKAFLAKQRIELVEKCIPKKLSEYSWSSKHDFRTDMKVDHSYKIWEYSPKLEGKQPEIYGLKHKFEQWVNMSDYKPRPDWCEFSDDERLYLFKFRKNYSLQELEEKLRKSQEKQGYFSIPKGKTIILDDFFWNDEPEMFDNLTSS
jgi:hypothetical protein